MKYTKIIKNDYKLLLYLMVKQRSMIQYDVYNNYKLLLYLMVKQRVSINICKKLNNKSFISYS